MNKLFLGQLDPIGFDNKLVLVRTDYNIPLITTSDGKVSVGNDARIRASLSSLHFLVNANARVVVCSHLGRPTHDGTSDATFSLFPVAERLQSLLADIPVTFVDDCIGPKVEILKEKLPPRSILLLENLRFHPEEENNDDMFAETLCAQVEIYVNEAFAASHRAHASTIGVASFVQKRYAGFGLHKELEFLGNSISNPIRPVAAVIGGLKVSTKMDIIYHLMEKIDKLLIGGAMIFTFFAALGHNVGDSYVEKSSIENALNIIRSAVGKNVILRFASDVVTVPTTVFKARHPKKFSHFNDDPEQELPLLCCKYDEIKKDWAGVDIGSQTIADFEMELSSCRTVIMNGPMGMFEDSEFGSGTKQLLQILERQTTRGCTTIVCGGDTVAAAEKFCCANFSHISMGGGASLELLAGRELPGVSIINDSVLSI